MEQNEVRTQVVTAGWNGHESNKEQPVNTAILAAAREALMIAEQLVAEATPLGENPYDKYGWEHGWACAISAARKAIRDLIAQVETGNQASNTVIGSVPSAAQKS